jgi:hypothetical protein
VIVVLLLLLAWAIVKWINLANSMRWAIAHGALYEASYHRAPPRTNEELYTLFELHLGNFFPLGTKSYKIRRLIERPHRIGLLGRVAHSAKAVLAILFLDTWAYIGLCGLVIALLDGFYSPSSTLFSALESALAVWLTLYSLLLIVEAVIWYMTAGSYARVYALLSVKTRGVGSEQRTPLDELLVFGPLVICSVLSLSSAVAQTQARYGVFSTLPRGSGFAQEAQRLLQAMYYVLANLSTVGSQSIEPRGTLARFEITVAFASGMLLLTLVVSLFLASTTRGR